ncbi:MAG: nucleotide exchange factor GrpE [Desulfobacterales bacterium]|nr:nucleotide exchange factor GrpE [Desulfobacterales bacterium]
MSEDKKVEKEPEKEEEESVDAEVVDEKPDEEEIKKEEAPGDPVKELEKRLEKAEMEARDNYDRFLRNSAEFDNYKKRSAREMDEFRKYANESLLRELLPVVDNLELAIKSSEESDQKGNGVVEGVNLTLSEILKVLKKFGVKQVEADEKPFDPAFHQAFLQEENNDLPENTVLKVFQKGYLLHERLIRPAMVVVSKKSTEPADDDANHSEENSKNKKND